MGDNRGISQMKMEGNVAENWKIWRSRFENYLIASEINLKSESTQCAQLLHYIGEECFRVYTTFTFQEDEKNKLSILLEKFEQHFLPKENVTYERYKFFSSRQQSGQSLEKFVTELKEAAIKCKLGNLQESLTKTVLICGLINNNIREKLLQEDQDDKMTLEEAVQICRILETSKQGVEPQEVHALKRDIKFIKACKRCGGNHQINKCPAYGKECFKCKKKNHFADWCNRGNMRTVSQVEQDVNEVKTVQCNDVSDSLFIGNIEVNALSNEWITEIKIRNKLLKFKIDTGAMVNVLPYCIFHSLGLNDKMIQKTNQRLTSYTGDMLDVKGTCILKCEKRNSVYDVNFFVVNNNSQTILGLRDCERMNLVKRVDNIHVANYYEDLIKKYEDRFSGIGCLNSKPYHIEIEKNAEPVVHPVRRVPIPLLDSLKNSLDELSSNNIIEKVEGPSDWVNPLVIVKKPSGKLRICLDPKDLNKVVKREHCQIPTLEQITCDMAGATIFSTLDAAQGFYQIKLDKESSDLCTFGTPFGRYKFLRLPYGLKPAPEVFQHSFQNLFKSKGVKVYIDDIIVWGRTKEEHDQRLRDVLEIARKNNVTFNLDKCSFGRKQIKFLGQEISNSGIKLTNERIQAILEMPEPKDKKGVQRLLGILTYISKYIKNFSHNTWPLRQLLKKDVEFMWLDDQKKAFESLKKILVSSPILQFYDRNKPIVLSVDSSRNGLGAVLSQDNLPCAYASKSLTETQIHYAQIEKELLAICFGMSKFYEYIYGKKITVETDHQPLLQIFKKPINSCPARLQRMLLQLQKFDFEVVYKRGKDLILADALSRAYLSDTYTTLDSEIEAQVCLLKCSINATPKKIEELKLKTENDQELQELIQMIKSGWPNVSKKLNENLKSYFPYRSELHVVDGIVFKGGAIVIPKILRNEMMERAHYSHLGINKTLSLVRDTIFWPGMINNLKQKITQCHLCLKYANSQSSEPLNSHNIPDLRWNKVGCDIFEIEGQKFLLVVDYFSKFVEVVLLGNNTTSRNVINSLKSIFCTHGIPLTLISDGGPQFTSEEFKEFTNAWEFTHIMSSPTYAQSNGMAERHIQTVKKIIKKTIEEKKDIYLALLNFKNACVETGYSSSQMLMSRNIRSNIISNKSYYHPKINKDVRRKLEDTRVKQAKYYNNGVKQLPEIPINTKVYIQIKPGSNWTPGVVIEKTRDRVYRVELENGSKLYRNRKFIRIIQGDIFSKQETQHSPFNSKENEDIDKNIPYYIDIENSKNSQENTCINNRTVTGNDNPDSIAHKKTSSGRVVKPPNRLDL